MPGAESRILGGRSGIPVVWEVVWLSLACLRLCDRGGVEKVVMKCWSAGGILEKLGVDSRSLNL